MKLFTISLIAITAMCGTMTAKADTVAADTLAVVNNAHNVLITRSPSTNTVTIAGQGNDRTFYYSYSAERVDSVAMAGKNSDEWGLSLPFLRETKRSKSEVTWGSHTQIGVCMPVNAPAGFDPSIDAAFGKLVGVNYTPWAKGPTFSIGAGIFAQKFTLHNNSMFDVDRKALVVTPLPEGARDSHVRLFNFGFETPLTITQNLYHGFSLSAGVVMKLNTYTTASNKYTIGNCSYETSFHELQQRILTYDIFGGIGWDSFGLYFRYAPVAMFKSGNGLQFDVISFGINLGF